MATGHILANPGPREAQNLKRLYNDNDIVRTSRLEQLATGRWAVIYNKREGKAWRRVPKSLGTQDRAQAERRYVDFLKDVVALSDGSLTVKTQPSIGDILDFYIENSRTHWEAGNSQPLFVRLLKNDLGQMTVDDLTPQVINAYKIKYAYLKNGSIRRRLACLTTAMNYAKKHRMIDSVALIDLPPMSAPRRVSLSKEQAAEFWDKAQQWPDKHVQEPAARRIALYVALALDTGARMGAILDLTWDRVNFARNQIDFQKPGRTISKKRRPAVPIAPRLRAVLEAEHAAQTRHGLPPQGRVISHSNIVNGYKTFAKAAGMPWATPHVLRHTFATLAADRGVPMAKLALMLGDTIGTVAKYYVNLTVEDLEGVV